MSWIFLLSCLLEIPEDQCHQQRQESMVDGMSLWIVTYCHLKFSSLASEQGQAWLEEWPLMPIDVKRAAKKGVSDWFHHVLVLAFKWCGRGVCVSFWDDKVTRLLSNCGASFEQLPSILLLNPLMKQTSRPWACATFHYLSIQQPFVTL